ncbi:MAG: hypothetical protein KAS87_06740, partial [Candidatus Omnitrophica bacterium]|nr:hypothetical protein [Candidatus Omnitrophota bacterium]
SPIQVNAFRQNVVGKDKVQFSFDIAHSGAGDVFEPGTDVTNSAVYCPKSSSDRRIKEDKVEIKVDTGINKPLKCVGLPLPGNGVSSGMIKLVNGKRTVTCTQTLPLERTDYTKSVDITLDFNYLDSTDREILVKHVIS